MLGITRDEAAEKVGVTKATISNWCTGAFPISAVGVRILGEMGVKKKALKNPAEEV
jgi:transcriptional regulator with XRE-family HTH domain